MTDETPIIQTVTLDNPEATTLAVKTEDGSARIFYDVSYLFVMLSQDHARRVFGEVLRGGGTMPDEKRAYFLGENHLIQHIGEQVNTLRDMFDMQESVAALDGVETLADMGFSGSDGDLS